MKTTTTVGRSSENGGRFAGGHFAGGHDGMANLCKPIAAYDFHVRYNKPKCIMLDMLDYTTTQMHRIFASGVTFQKVVYGKLMTNARIIGLLVSLLVRI